MASLFSRRDFLPAGLKAVQVEIVGSMIRIYLSRSAKAAAACPRCGTVARHIHSRYQRRPADLPAHGRKVELVLLVRRFRCGLCIAQQRFWRNGFRRMCLGRMRAAPPVYKDWSGTLGRPAQALAARLLLPISKDTFLRSIRNTTEAAKSDLRVIGIDDWAWRKGQIYGTLICDLERHRVVDLLPDREPATVEAWLRDRPGIAVVARDRNGGYRGAVSRALPRAVHPLGLQRKPLPDSGLLIAGTCWRMRAGPSWPLCSGICLLSGLAGPKLHIWAFERTC